jgi:hypothetical protein
MAAAADESTPPDIATAIFIALQFQVSSSKFQVAVVLSLEIVRFAGLSTEC